MPLTDATSNRQRLARKIMVICRGAATASLLRRQTVDVMNKMYDVGTRAFLKWTRIPTFFGSIPGGVSLLGYQGIASQIRMKR